MRYLMHVLSPKTLLWIGLSLLLVVPPARAQADAVVGVWLTEDKDGKIEIYRSGNQFFGKLIWGKDSNDEKGQPRLDSNNPDPQLRKRKLIGMVLMANFVHDQGNVWKEGTVYDSRSGKTYSCKMTLVNKNTLEVRGFIGVSLLGKTTTWTRVQAGT